MCFFQESTVDPKGTSIQDSHCPQTYVSNNLKPTNPRDLPSVSNDMYHSDYYEETFKKEYDQLVKQNP